MRTTYELTASGKEFSFPQPVCAVDARLIADKFYDGFRIFQDGCNHLNYSLYSFLLLSKGVAANNENLYWAVPFFRRQTLFVTPFACINNRFNSGNLSRRVLRRNLLCNIGIFTLNQLFANRKSKPSATSRDSCSKSSNDVTKMIYLLREFASKKQKCNCNTPSSDDDIGNKQHAFKALMQNFSNFFGVHSFLRVLGWDFFRDSQILPSTAETSVRRIG